MIASQIQDLLFCTCVIQTFRVQHNKRLTPRSPSKPIDSCSCQLQPLSQLYLSFNYKHDIHYSNRIVKTTCEYPDASEKNTKSPQLVVIFARRDYSLVQNFLACGLLKCLVLNHPEVKEVLGYLLGIVDWLRFSYPLIELTCPTLNLFTKIGFLG